MAKDKLETRIWVGCDQRTYLDPHKFQRKFVFKDRMGLSSREMAKLKVETKTWIGCNQRTHLKHEFQRKFVENNNFRNKMSLSSGESLNISLRLEHE